MEERRGVAVANATDCKVRSSILEKGCYVWDTSELRKVIYPIRTIGPSTVIVRSLRQSSGTESVPVVGKTIPKYNQILEV
jgi:hypothetical protein